jgi:methylmalonyl-CoA/ethylmalonyl-CoA epimerase
MNAETEAPAVHLDTVGQIAVTVSNLERSRSFYLNTLGMKFLFDAGNMAFFQCGAVRFMIGTADRPAQPGGTIIYFRVADIHETHAALVARGVEFIQKPHLVARMQEHDLWMAFLRDPDQNPIGLMCERTRDSASEAEAA